MFNSDYIFIAKEVAVNEVIKGEIKEMKTIMICTKYENGLIIPNFLTDFIKRNYEYHGKSLNSLDMPARTVCKFLNFCLNKVKENDPEFVYLKNDGLKDLKRLHGSRYISDLTLKGLQKTTVLQYEKYLSSFFIYLKKTKLIEEEFELINLSSSNKKEVYKSVFRDPTLPTRLPGRNTINKRSAKLKDFGTDRINLTNLFINISQDIAPEISLALCFMFYGGLRRGEVVNLSKDSIVATIGESLEIKISDNREKFFYRLKDTKAENPKRLNYLTIEMARQTILDNNLVWDIYSKHMKQLEIYKRRGFLKIDDAFFVDSEGYPMSGRVFEKHFLKVKDAFLRLIKEHKDYDLISSSTWNTHIGRGVFTNMLIDVGFTPTQLAIARGDRNINSALSYIDKSLTTQQIQEAINKLKDYDIEGIGVIRDEELLKAKTEVK